MSGKPTADDIPEIEVTTAMIEAGEREFCAFDPRFESEADGARSVYLAMAGLSPQIACLASLSEPLAHVHDHRQDTYSEQETQSRFLGTLKAALNTPPKPLKSMTRKGVKAQSKKRQRRDKSRVA